MVCRSQQLDKSFISLPSIENSLNFRLLCQWVFSFNHMIPWRLNEGFHYFLAEQESWAGSRMNLVHVKEQAQVPFPSHVGLVWSSTNVNSEILVVFAAAGGLLYIVLKAWKNSFYKQNGSYTLLDFFLKKEPFQSFWPRNFFSSSNGFGNWEMLPHIWSYSLCHLQIFIVLLKHS